MSPTAQIHVLYHQALDYWNRLIGLEPPESDVLLIPDLTRYFFSEAIDHRVKSLADGVASQEESYRDAVNREYQTRVEQAVRQELKTYSIGWPCCAELESRLNKIKLPTHFNDDLFARRASVIEFMRKRMVFLPGRLDRSEALVVAGSFLRAIQQVALDIIRVEYPPTAAGTEVPPGVQDIVRRILARVEKVQRLLQTPVELKSMATTETELRVLVARAKGVVCLPLRSIPTAPLSSKDLEKHYVGRPDEQTLRLARQIRHADGTILVTGYRGVGKSSFVNRIIFHALAAQKEIPEDGWVIVPVTVNLAKVSGVQNILRITLRSVRDALLEADSRTPRPIPGLDSTPLPLSREDEIEPLEEAYIRATYKVTMSQGSGSERRSELGSSFSINPSKWLGGSIVGMELGKFLEAGIKKTKTEKINRELSLLDFDENAAEESLGRLIRSLARPRPVGPDGPNVRIKLVFVFDELDKMDMKTGLEPMIEGLKNLFLQQYSVFMLVTSKGFYYQLLKDRAIEDAMLNSYFSAVVHVPLLSYAQARQMVDDWVDWNATEQLKTKKPAETKLIDQLTRVLVYRSFGNPRDIIRELRLMQEWADTEQPYLTDRMSKSPSLQIFAALQDCVEKTAVPPQAKSSSATADDGSVTLVSERLVGDEARLEQVRRGLYILTEELINRQTLPLESNSSGPQPAPDKKREPTLLENIQTHNFSLLSLDDVRQLAKRLGGYLSLIHDNPDLFVTPDWGTRAPLFEMEANELRVNNTFYTLTGRQATAATSTEPSPATPETKTVDELIAEAENYALQEGWSAQLRAINLIKQFSPDKLTPALKEFLWKVVTTDTDPTHRFAAAERLPTKIETQEQLNTITGLLSTETNERVMSILLRLLGGASGEAARKSATDAIVTLLARDAESRPQGKLSEGTAVAALTVLQTVASHDVTSELLNWMIVAADTELVQTTAVSTLRKISEQFGVDMADRILSNDKYLELFATGLVEREKFKVMFLPDRRPGNILRSYLLELLDRDPFASVSRLLKAAPTVNVHGLMVNLWDVIFSPPSETAAIYVFSRILELSPDLFKTEKLILSLLDSTEFQARTLPDLRRQLPLFLEKKLFTADQAKTIETVLADMEGRLIAKASAEPVIFDPTAAWLRKQTKSPSSSLPDLSLGYFITAILFFLPGFFLYKRDLPAEASIGTTLKSRLLLLVLDGLLVYGFISAFRWLRSSGEVGKSQAASAFATLFLPLVGAIIYLHTTYIGPLHFWSQALQFIINWPATVALLMAFGLFKPLTK